MRDRWRRRFLGSDEPQHGSTSGCPAGGRAVGALNRLEDSFHCWANRGTQRVKAGSRHRARRDAACIGLPLRARCHALRKTSHLASESRQMLAPSHSRATLVQWLGNSAHTQFRALAKRDNTLQRPSLAGTPPARCPNPPGGRVVRQLHPSPTAPCPRHEASKQGVSCCFRRLGYLDQAPSAKRG